MHVIHSFPARLGALLGLLCLAACVSAAPWQIPPQPLPQGAERGLIAHDTPLLQAPSPTAGKIRSLLKDLSVAVYGSQNGFAAVQLRNGQQGWVALGAIRPEKPLPGHRF